MSIKIIKHGIATTIQDLGRPGYYHLGIPIGGAMDRLALRSANLLVGNDESAPGIETVFMGPEIEFTENSIVAVTGAELPPKVDGETQPTWTAFEVKKGQILNFDYLRSGARAYIAFAGGITTPPSLGSRSTHVIGALGGVNGRAVQSGDELPLGADSNKNIKIGITIPESLRNTTHSRNEIRVLPGLYEHRITPKSSNNFYSDIWKVASEARSNGISISRW